MKFNIISKSDAQTTIKSKMFQEVLKYDVPNAISFNNASDTNIAVNT